MVAQKTFVVFIAVVGGVLWQVWLEKWANGSTEGTFNYYLLHTIRI